MALIDCPESGSAVPVAVVTKNTPWQDRLKAAGLTQKRLAALLGTAQNTVSRQMIGELAVPGYVDALVTAWELMTDEQREALIKRRERKPPKPDTREGE